MKIIFINYRTIKKIIIVCAVLLLLSIIGLYMLKNKTKETFLDNDIFYKGTVDDKVLAFTCNVDWGNEFIPSMLDIFERNDISITFFVTGRWAENNEDILKTILDKGHEIGNHGYLHRDYSQLNYELNKNEILKADNIIKKITGYQPKYFAPPSGAYNDYTIKAANDLNYDVIMWSIDTIDWREDSNKDIIINRVISKHHNSAIVLMHPKEETIKALPYIISTLNNKGYKIGKVSDIIK